MDLSFLPAVNASLNAEAKTIVASSDGSRLFVGGSFTRVNGVDRYRIAALDPVTGALIPGFHASTNYRVNVLVASGDTLYAGGQFSVARGVARQRLAAFSAWSGALSGWAPRADDEVHAMTGKVEQFYRQQLTGAGR